MSRTYKLCHQTLVPSNETTNILYLNNIHIYLNIYMEPVL